MTKDEKKKKLTKHLDRLVMGAIIGGAVLSVIGARRLAKKRREAQENPLNIEMPKPKKKGLFRRLLGL